MCSIGAFFGSLLPCCWKNKINEMEGGTRVKALTKRFVAKWATMFASLALLIAASSVQTTCLFMSYQPDLPDELKCE